MAEIHAVELLVQALKRLPGVGVKSAQRMAFHLLQHDRPGAQRLAAALSHALQDMRHCVRCHTIPVPDYPFPSPRPPADALGWLGRRPRLL